jgi:hypothetical protein
MALTVNPTLPVVAVQAAGGAGNSLVLQPGTVVTAQVQNILAENLVRITIANLSLDVVSQIPLQAGQTLQLAVSQAETGTMRLAVVGQGGAAVADSGLGISPPLDAATAASVLAAAPNDRLTPLERIAVSVAAEDAAAQQQSLAPLFANLNAAAGSGSLPPAVQQAVGQVLARQTPLDQNLTGGDIQNAFEKSGLFLESSLATGSVAPSGGGVPDLKAALIVLRQTLATALGAGEAGGATTASTSLTQAAAAPGVPPASVKAASPAATSSPPLAPEIDASALAAALKLGDAAGNPGQSVLAQALQAGGAKLTSAGVFLGLLQEAQALLPRATGNPATTRAVLPDGTILEPPARAAAPPPFRGGLPSAQPVASASIGPDAPLTATAHRLLEDTDAAIARQTLLQVASLPDRADQPGARADATAPKWNFEIPFATPQGTAMAQFEISRDGGGAEAEAAKRVWRARFSLDVEPAGPVHALITFSGDRTSVRMWAERPATASQLRAGAAELSQALSQAELVPGDIVIRDGTPPQSKPAPAGHFLDRAL